MLLPDKPSIQFLLECWLPEFRNAIEMFTGRALSLEWEVTPQNEGKTEPQDLITSMVEFTRDASATMRVDVSQGDLGSLMESIEAADEEQASLFREMLEQSLTGAVFQMNARAKDETVVPVNHRMLPDQEFACESGDVLLRIFSPEIPEFIIFILIREPEESIFLPVALPTLPDEFQQVLMPGAERFSRLQMAVSVVLGRARVPTREVLKFTNGSVIELDRSMPDAIEVVVHGRVVARGEVVSVQGNYGIRIKELMSRDDRVTLGQNISAFGGVEVQQ